MPRYFTHLASSNAPKNALQRAVSALLERQSNRIIDDADLFIHGLTASIDSLNEDHPRCTPLRPSIYKHGSTIHLYLGAVFTVSFAMRPVKEDAE